MPSTATAATLTALVSRNITTRALGDPSHRRAAVCSTQAPSAKPAQAAGRDHRVHGELGERKPRGQRACAAARRRARRGSRSWRRRAARERSPRASQRGLASADPFAARGTSPGNAEQERRPRARRRSQADEAVAKPARVGPPGRAPAASPPPPVRRRPRRGLLARRRGAHRGRAPFALRRHARITTEHDTPRDPSGEAVRSRRARSSLRKRAGEMP